MTKVNATIKTVARELAENVGWDNMEFYLKQDGETGTRQSGSFGLDENEVVYKVSLDKWYWREGLENIGLDIEELTEEDFETLVDYLEEVELGEEDLEWEEN